MHAHMDDNNTTYSKLYKDQTCQHLKLKEALRVFPITWNRLDVSTLVHEN